MYMPSPRGNNLTYNQRQYTASIAHRFASIYTVSDGQIAGSCKKLLVIINV